jgi:hypothetical protein
VHSVSTLGHAPLMATFSQAKQRVVIAGISFAVGYAVSSSSQRWSWLDLRSMARRLRDWLRSHVRSAGCEASSTAAQLHLNCITTQATPIG